MLQGYAVKTGTYPGLKSSSLLKNYMLNSSFKFSKAVLPATQYSDIVLRIASCMIKLPRRESACALQHRSDNLMIFITKANGVLSSSLESMMTVC